MSVYFTDTGTSIKGLGCALMAFASDARTRAHWPRVLRARAAMHMGGFYSPRPWPTKGGQGRRMKARIGSKGRRKGLCEAGGEGGRGVECPGRTRGGRGGGEGDKGKGGKGGRGLNALAEQRDGGRGFLGPGREGGGQGGRGKGTRCRRRKPRACRGDALMITYVIHVHACFLSAHMQYHRNLPISDRNYGNCNHRNPIQYHMLRFAIWPRRRGGDRTPAPKSVVLNTVHVIK
jgi:hypothetical protein